MVSAEFPLNKSRQRLNQKTILKASCGTPLMGQTISGSNSAGTKIPALDSAAK